MFKQETTDYSPVIKGNVGYERQKSFVQNSAQTAPSDDPEEMRAYCLMMARRFFNTTSGSSQIMLNDFQKYEDYSQGIQSMEHWKQLKNYNETTVGKTKAAKQMSDEAARSIGLGYGQDGDFLRFKGLSSILDAAQGKIVPMKRDVIISAIDGYAMQKKQSEINKTIASNYIKSQLPPETLQYSDPTGQQPIEKKPLPIERILTKGCNHVLNLHAGKWRECEKYLARTCLKQGISGVKINVTPTYSIDYRPVDVTNLIIQFPTQRDCSDLKTIGEIIIVPIADLMAMDTEGYYRDSWNSCPSYDGTGVMTPSGLYLDRRVRVLDFEWTDVKRDTNAEILCVYRAKWVIDTNIILDFGQREFQVRGDRMAGHFNDISEFSYILYSPYVAAKSMKINSLVARAENSIKDYELNRINFYLEIINAIPTAYIFSEGTLELVDEMFSGLVDSTGTENKKNNNALLAWEMLRTGKMIMPDPEAVAGLGIIKPEPPFKIDGGVPKAAMDYITLCKEAINSIKENLGIPAGMDASTSDPNLPVYAQQAAMQASQSVLSEIADSDENIFIRVCRQIIMILPQLAWELRNGTIEYSDILTMFSDQEIDIMADIHTVMNHSFDFGVTSAPTGEQMMQFEQSLDIAVQAGIITGGERIDFSRKSKNDFETALSDLMEAEKRNKSLQHEQQMAIQQANAEGNANAAKLASDRALQKTAQEGQNEIAKVQAQLAADLQRMEYEEQIAMRRLEKEYALKAKLELLILENTPTKPQPK